MNVSAAPQGEGAAAPSEAEQSGQLAPEEKWNREVRMACRWAFCGIIAAGVGFESLVKLYELWAERTDLRPDARAAFSFVFIAVAAIAVYAFWRFFVAAVTQGRMVLTTSQADIKRAATAERCPALITALSTCNDHAKAQEVAEILAHHSNLQNRLAAFCADADLQGVSWQQTIRGIWHHVQWDGTPAVVPEVRVLLSSGPNGSAKQWPQFVRLLEVLFAGVPDALERIEPVGLSRGIDFEIYNVVVRYLEAELMALETIVGEGKVMIDATGGQKPFSIAAAIVSLRSPRQKFQYVTNQGEVTHYNAVATGQMLP